MKQDGRRVWASCPDCLDHYRTDEHLRGACASLGIEYGIDTYEMLRRYMARYHHDGHKSTRDKES